MCSVAVKVKIRIRHVVVIAKVRIRGLGEVHLLWAPLSVRSHDIADNDSEIRGKDDILKFKFGFGIKTKTGLGLCSRLKLVCNCHL